MLDAPVFTPETTAHSRQEAAKATDVRTLLHDSDYHWMREADTDLLTLVGHACQSQSWNPVTAQPPEIAPYLAFARLLQPLRLEPACTNSDTMAFAWGGLRCIFAGAGYHAHRMIASTLCDLNAYCPFDPDESEATWIEALAAAHQASGLPATISTIPFSPVLSYGGGNPESEGDLDTRWFRALFALFLLRHVRVSETANALRITLHGRCLLISAAGARSSSLGDPLVANALARELHLPASSGKGAKLHGVLAHRVLSCLSSTNLLAATPMRYLPARYLAGPVVRLIPGSRHDREGRADESGLRLSALWEATDHGKIVPCAGTDDLATTWDWPVMRPNPHAADEQARFEAGLPASYAAESPADMLVAAWPNLYDSWSGEHLDAYRSIIDAIFVASAIRNEAPGVWADEVPLVFVFPATPTHEESTNTGKSTLSTVIARAFVPGMPNATLGRGTGAPDARAIANFIATWGTAHLDEWKPPKDQAHPLHRDQLQSLATGTGIVMGRVLENEGQTIRPTFPLVFNCKAFNCPDDIASRMLPLYLARLTEEARATPVDMQISVRLRLSAYAVAHALDLADPGQIQKLGLLGFRFPRHAFIAARIWQARTGGSWEDAQTAINEAGLAMRRQIIHHVGQAIDSDLLAEQERGEQLILRWSDLRELITPTVATAIAEHARTSGRGVMTAGVLIRTVATVLGCPPCSYSRALEQLLGVRLAAPDRVVAKALSVDLMRLMPKPWSHSPAGNAEATMSGWVIQNTPAGAHGSQWCICPRPRSPGSNVDWLKDE